MATTVNRTSHGSDGHLSRDIGFWGLMFVSLGSIIGSGWLRRPGRRRRHHRGHAPSRRL